MSASETMPRVVAGYFLLDDTILVAKLRHGPYEGCWELPSGQPREGETDAAALRRAWLSTLGSSIEVGRLRGAYPCGSATLALYYAHLDSPYVVPKAGPMYSELRYLTLDELRTLTPLAPATRVALGLP